jgi:hypothetical protein
LGYFPTPVKENFLQLSINNYPEYHDRDNLTTVTIISVFSLSPEDGIYEGKVYNIFELTGTLGGIFEVFDLFFGFILGSISSYMFRKDLKKDILKSEKEYLSIKLSLEELRKDIRQNKPLQNIPEEEQKTPHQPDSILHLMTHKIKFQNGNNDYRQVEVDVDNVLENTMDKNNLKDF